MIFETKLAKAVWISSHHDLDFVYLQLIFISMGIFALFQIWRHSNLLKFCFKDFSWSNWIFRFLNSIWWMNVLLSRHVCILGSCIPSPNDSFWGFQKSKNYFHIFCESNQNYLKYLHAHLIIFQTHEKMTPTITQPWFCSRWKQARISQLHLSFWEQGAEKWMNLWLAVSSLVFVEFTAQWALSS